MFVGRLGLGGTTLPASTGDVRSLCGGRRAGAGDAGLGGGVGTRGPAGGGRQLPPAAAGGADAGRPGAGRHHRLRRTGGPQTQRRAGETTAAGHAETEPALEPARQGTAGTVLQSH